jgi:hypothetical protein
LEMKDLRPPKKPKQKYEPTEREKTALDRYHAQKAAAPAAPRMKVINDKKEPTIAPDHPDKPLAFLPQLGRRSQARPRTHPRSALPVGAISLAAPTPGSLWVRTKLR